MKPMIAPMLWLTLFLFTLLAATPGCGRRGDKSAASSDKITIKLAENPWTGSSINVNVAKILLDKLGYKVELVTLDENAQWAALATGDLSASLEIWPSGHQEAIEQYIDNKKVVVNIGELGVVGKIGWYVPAYVVEQHAELATVEGFKDPARAALFKTAETGEKGRFLTGDPSWVQYDGDIIKNLGLNLQVVSAGSEQAVLAAVDSAYSRKEPVLFYFWTPHAIHAKYKLTEVKLPAHSKACYAKIKEGGVDCDYPPDRMFKVAFAGLEKQAPDAYTVLKRMRYSTDEQVAMIAAVELDKKSPRDVAEDWLDRNQATWNAWMPVAAEQATR
ncbi:MAG: ABC transporter substrate-binding protein [Proteobacteria bacterium]|nr:ABC transporter substrate-binding protein [Pseudomonadota bacterium]